MNFTTSETYLFNCIYFWRYVS